MVDIFTDGSGKTGRYAYVVEQTGKVKISQKPGLTNNEAEYTAIVEALKDNNDKNICIYADSELIVNQLNKKYAIKEDRLRKLAQQVWELSEGRNVTFKWIRREQNKAGKVLG